MTLLSGSALVPEKYFTGGNPAVQGSSFDLSVGKIYDNDGREVQGPFTLQPGHMVQVVSAEVFNLPDNITGHVTYKTTLTKKGIWALTVGIVDPGWNGPVATTLLNFSSVSHTIHQGDRFLRASLFEHDPVPAERLRKSGPLPDYLKGVQSLAASRFPPTFLNSEPISLAAGKHVLDRIRSEGLAWLGGIVVVFTIIQVFAPPAAKWLDSWWSPSGVVEMQEELNALKSRIADLEASKSESPEPPAQATVPPAPDLPADVGE